MPPVLSIDCDGEGVLLIAGEVDAATAPELERRLCADPSIHVLDMAHVSFIDCWALRVLLDAHRSRGGALVVREPSPAVRRLLRLTELERTFGLPDEER